GGLGHRHGSGRRRRRRHRRGGGNAGRRGGAPAEPHRPLPEALPRLIRTGLNSTGLQDGRMPLPRIHALKSYRSTSMGIITMIIVGFIVALLARALKPGIDRMGIIMTTLIGITGSFLA